MTVRVDGAGNLRGVYPGSPARAPRLFLGSHLDTVVRAGAFDGVLGVVLAIAIVDGLEHRRLPFTIEVVGFSEEEGVRFGVPFIGSRALVGAADQALLDRRDAHGRSVADAIRDYGLDPVEHCAGRRRRERDRLPRIPHRAGPGTRRPRNPARDRRRHRRAEPRHDDVHRIGESRRDHADARAPGCAGGCRRMDRPGRSAWPGDTRVWSPPSDASRPCRALPTSLSAAARSVSTSGMRDDAARRAAVATLLDEASRIAARRQLDVGWNTTARPSVGRDEPGAGRDARTRGHARGLPVHRMASGAGHDAMIMAARMPAAMLFLRSPGGISHHPDETVVEADVAAALAVGHAVLDDLARTCGVIDVVVRGGTVVTPNGQRQADVAIEDGRIRAVSPDVAGGRRRDRRRVVCTCCRASSTCTCTSTNLAGPSGRARPPEAGRWPPAAARCSSTCRSTRRRAR